MTTTTLTGPVDEFLDTARRAVRTTPGAAALTTLTWWDLLDCLEDDELRPGVFALFRAQGRELADTPALGALVAQPYLAAAGLEPGSAIAALASPAPGTALVLGDLDGRQVLVDLPGSTPSLYETTATVRRALPGRLTVHDVALTGPATPLPLPDPELAEARQRATTLGRIAAAAEILGAAEGAVALAVEHAGLREQFGEPIGRFQAVRHLLAWAETDTVALAATVREAVRGLESAPEGYDEVVKALAGRNGRRACERALQVLGGIGFTAEHYHHHHHGRVLLLDTLLGTSAALTVRIGARVREAGTTPPLTEHALGRVE